MYVWAVFAVKIGLKWNNVILFAVVGVVSADYITSKGQGRLVFNLNDTSTAEIEV